MALWPMMMHHHTKFGNKGSPVQKITRQIFIDILIFPMTSPVKAVLKFFHNTLQLMMMYHQTKPGCKKISNSEDTVEIVIFCLYDHSL